jgi:hypothetical protein
MDPELLGIKPFGQRNYDFCDAGPFVFRCVKEMENVMWWHDINLSAYTACYVHRIQRCTDIFRSRTFRNPPSAEPVAWVTGQDELGGAADATICGSGPREYHRTDPQPFAIEWIDSKLQTGSVRGDIH